MVFSSNFQNLKEAVEGMEDEGNFLRRSVNDITSLLDINFGSLGRPRRGGRGGAARGGTPRGGLSSLPERVKPTLERVRSTLKETQFVVHPCYLAEIPQQNVFL